MLHRSTKLALGLVLLLAACGGDGPTSAGSGADLIPRLLDFGTGDVGSSSIMVIRAVNNGGEQIRVGDVEISGPAAADFVVNGPTSFNLPAGGSAEIEVRFAPSQTGERTARLKLVIAGTSNPVATLRGGGRGSLVATLVDQPPLVDGDTGDAAWRVPGVLRLNMTKLEPAPDEFSSDGRRDAPAGTLRAVYTADSLYLLMIYDDPDENRLPDRWQLAGDGWRRDKPGNDGVSFIWPINTSIPAFASAGCASSCHRTSSLDIPGGGHYPEEGQQDIWYWQAGITDPFGRADDQHADASSDRRVPDNDFGPFATPNFTTAEDGEPLWMAADDNNGLDMRYWIWLPDAATFRATGLNPATGQAWHIGDVVPGWTLGIPGGGRIDVHARGRHVDGRWIVEFARALETGDAADVRFDIAQSYSFAVAVHDRQRRFSLEEHRALPSPPHPPHYGVALLRLVFR